MSTSFKPQPQIRQHGFHLPSPPREEDYSTNDNITDFRQPPLDFADELVSLMSSEKQQHHQHQQQQHQQQQQQQQQYDDYRPQNTHNIFDISAPNMSQHHFALNPTNTSHHDSSRLDFPSHFNSTLPALNSSMRYEPHPDPPISSFRPHSRSRSRSRPPTNGSVGPVRTRRGNSVSSSVGGAPSPPPGGRPHPHAIVIPSSHPRPSTSNSSWLSNGQDPYSLPTPESLHSPSLLSSHASQYSPFGFSPSSHHDHTGYGSLPSHHNLAISPITGGINTLGFATSPVTPTPSSVPTHSATIPTPSTSSSSATPTTNGAAAVAAVAVATSAQSAAEKLANEKRRRRRESHNAVERRRRDNINERIGELATLIPECMLNDTAPPTHAMNEDGEEGASPPVKERNPNSGMKKGEDGVVKANKGMILRKSVDYIRYLQELVDAQGQRNRQLEQELKAYRSGNVPSSSPTATPVLPTLPGSNSSSSSSSSSANHVNASSANGLVSFGDESEWMDVDSSGQYGILGYPISSTKSQSRSAARGSDSGGSPLTQIEEDDSEDEEERGRATRSRRVKKEA